MRCLFAWIASRASLLNRALMASDIIRELIRGLILVQMGHLAAVMDRHVLYTVRVKMQAACFMTLKPSIRSLILTCEQSVHCPVTFYNTTALGSPPVMRATLPASIFAMSALGQMTRKHNPHPCAAFTGGSVVFWCSTLVRKSKLPHQHALRDLGNLLNASKLPNFHSTSLLQITAELQ